jgi:hypothetical protein
MPRGCRDNPEVRQAQEEGEEMIACGIYALEVVQQIISILIFPVLIGYFIYVFRGIRKAK